MKNHTFKPVVIFSLNLINPSQERLLLESKGIKYIPCLGSYRGEQENSYVINYEDFDKISPLIDYCNQEYVLFLDNQRNAYLVYVKNHKTEYLGRWIEVSERVAKAEDAWSQDLNTGHFYIVD